MVASPASFSSFFSYAFVEEYRAAKKKLSKNMSSSKYLNNNEPKALRK